MSSKHHQILIVDDIADSALLLQTLLATEGYTADIADSGRLALQKMQVAPPDLVLLDVMMPEIDGYDLTRSIRRDDRLRFIPIILITAHVEACRIRGLAAGATDFIRKPVDIDELLVRIETFLHNKGGKKR